METADERRGASQQRVSAPQHFQLPTLAIHLEKVNALNPLFLTEVIDCLN
jgi:hypothetical protein